MMGFPWWLFWITVITGLKGRSHVRGEEVTYDGRSLIINGQRSILFSGSIHYPRSTPEMWPSLISKAKEGGLDVIQTYVFWNVHEPRPGQYDFSGRYDLVKFINEIKAQGLYVCLRIGPFIEAEWTYGGFPFWLHDIPDITYRSDNEPFKYYMQNFTTKIVNMMKSEGLYASQGGPIILSQIENEYQTIEGAFHDKGRSYINWAAKMAVQLQTGVPWLMCKQTDAPDPIINTCNGMRCGETFSGPNSPEKPTMWTENWTSFYQVYGGLPYIRSAQDIAFHVALFIAKNGSYVNYYMYHGGTNFGRTGSPYATTSYYDQAPIDEYGLLRQPKWGHLKELHYAIKTCSTTILEGKHSSLVLGQLQEGFFYREEMGDCVAFLVNNDARKNATVQFENRSYELLPKSISILSGCENVIFDTAKVYTKGNRRMMNPILKFDSAENWKVFKDVIPKAADSDLKFDGLVEQMNITKDKSDYLWYTTGFDYNLSCSEAQLHVESLGHVVHAFLNHNYIGETITRHMFFDSGRPFPHFFWNGGPFLRDRAPVPEEMWETLYKFEISVMLLGNSPVLAAPTTIIYLVEHVSRGADHGSHNAKNMSMDRPIVLNEGRNTLSLLSVITGLPDSGAFLERRFAGLTRVEITCDSQLFYNFTSNFAWEYQVGLEGEKLEIYNEDNLENVKWDEIGDSIKPPLTWYKTSFDGVDGDEPIALNLSSMGKGEAWVNGHSIGRYWVSFLNSKAVPSQSLYHVPRAFVKESGNVLVVLEEYGGNPLLISLNKVTLSNPHQSLHSFQ